MAWIFVPPDSIGVPVACDDLRPTVAIDVHDMVAVISVVLVSGAIRTVSARNATRSGQPVCAIHNIDTSVRIQIGRGAVLKRADEEIPFAPAQPLLAILAVADVL